MIKLRIDVDYPYPSRAKSFLYVGFRIKKRKSGNYLKNARIIAKMINESPEEVKAYWFFTPYTIPDAKFLGLLNPSRHEVGLHVVVNPYREWKILENETNRTINYYTIHGTEWLVAQLLWGRWRHRVKQAKVPDDFPVRILPADPTNNPTFQLDLLSQKRGYKGMMETLQRWAGKEVTWSIHPEWLFKAGRARGPYYQVLKSFLEVDKELDPLRTRKIGFAKIASSSTEYQKNVYPTDDFLEKLRERGIDVFSFLERKWSSPVDNPPAIWKKTEDNVAMLQIENYEGWWSNVGKKTRNMVRRAEKCGVRVAIVEPSDTLAEGIWKIYNETPVRQERAFLHYGEPLATVAGNMYGSKENSTFIGAYLNDELVGFIQLLYGEDIVIISQILSMMKHWDKALNNALLAKAVEVCSSKSQRWLMYGRIGNHPSLDKFKESNGFVRYPLTRYFVPLTWKGKVDVRLGLQREFKDALPQSLKGSLIPVMNWVSRNRARSKAHVGGKTEPTN
jgi:hypothetical protein